MALLRRDEVDLAVAVLRVVPAHEAVYPAAGLFQRGKATRRPVVLVFQHPEQGLDKGIVIADPGPAVRW